MNADKRGSKLHFARDPAPIQASAHFEMRIPTGTRPPVELRSRHDEFSDYWLMQN
jgi:hypothetical protein